MRKPKLATAAAMPDPDLELLVANRPKLEARKAELDAAAAKAVADRRETLINGSDAAVSAEAERICREAEGAALAAADALAEVDRRIAEAEATIAADALQAEREAAAGDLEQSADAIERASVGVEVAVAALATAHDALVTAISGGAAAVFSPTHADTMAAVAAKLSDFTPNGIAERLTLGALVAAIPSVNVIDGKASRPAWMPPATIEPSEVRQAAGEIATALRSTAGTVRSGQASPPIAAHLVRAVPSFEACGEAEVCVTAPFFFNWKDSARTMVTRGLRSLKAPIADAAVAKGLATRDLGEANRLPGRHNGSLGFANTGATAWDECADLQFDFDAWKAAESVRHASGLSAAA